MAGFGRRRHGVASGPTLEVDRPGLQIDMATARALLLLTLLPALALLGAGTAYALEYQCERGGANRSIAVEYQEPRQQVPCEVVYHKPPQDPSVLWRAASEVGFCEAKAEELVETLESGGWACDELEDAAAAAPREPTTSPPESAQPSAPREEPARAPQSPEPTVEPERQAAPREPTEPAEQHDQTATPPQDTPDPALEAALTRDLNKLTDSSDAEVKANGASYGDLNGDGQDDAAVLITFDDGGDGYVQYLVAYLSADDSYQPVASHLVGGRHREVHGGEIMGISSGAIVLDLQILKPEDAACCPSGSRTAVFVLEDGELKRIGGTAAGSGQG